MNKHPHQARPLTLALIEELPIEVMDALQDKLREFLGENFTVVLAGSGGREESTHYHLQIHCKNTELCVETHDVVQADFIEKIFNVARQMKAMMGNTATLNRMSGNGDVRLLCWISDAACTPKAPTKAKKMPYRKRSFQVRAV
ncbi:MAG TPA: hypothetical protein VF682_24880 [Pseudomonas sp.]